MSSSADVLDEATMALINEMDHLQRSSQSQDIARYAQMQSLIADTPNSRSSAHGSTSSVDSPLKSAHVCPCDIDAKECLDQAQIESWIATWTREHATGKSAKSLKLFLNEELKVCSDPKKQCNGCDQPFATFLLMPMRPNKAGTYDPEDYHLF